MPSRIVSRRDLEFQLFEVLDVESLRKRPRFSQHSRETMLGAVDTALAIAEEKFAPHNRKADEHEPTFDGSRVQLIPEVKEGSTPMSPPAFSPPARISRMAACNSRPR